MSVAWYEEVDTALIAEIRRSVRYPSGESTSELGTNSIVVKKPEEDYKIEVYPSVSIYNISTNFDYIRHVPDGRMDITKDIDEGTMTYKKKPIPFSFDYQLDFWSEYQVDMNMMLKTWLASHYRQFNLPINGTDLTTSCNAVQKGVVTKSDELIGTNRIYHSIINYEIWVDLMDNSVYNGYIVKSRDIGLSLNINDNEGGRI